MSLKPRLVGVAAAALMLLVDQAHKVWMLNVFDMPNRPPVRVAPFLDLVMAWNKGVSYSLLEADSDLGRYGLLALTLGATVLLAGWMWRAPHVVTGLGSASLLAGPSAMASTALPMARWQISSISTSARFPGTFSISRMWASLRALPFFCMSPSSWRRTRPARDTSSALKRPR